MTTAQVIGAFTRGGAERLALNLASGLAGRGQRSFAIALKSAGLGPDEIPEGVGLVQLGAGMGGSEMTGALLRLRRFVHEEGIEVLHVHGKASLPFCAAAALGLRPRPRLLFTWHSPEQILDERGRRLALMRWALKQCDRVYAPSREIAERLAERVNLRRAPEVFRNGVPAAPAEWRERRDGEEDVPTIVWAARMVPTKDPHALIRAAARLREEGWRLRVVLAGSAPPKMEWFIAETVGLVRELGLEGVVEMPGWLGDTTGLFARSSIAVQSSRSEGLSLSLLEQMMAGLAVVATDVGDTAEAVLDGRTGVLVPPGDDGALTDAIRMLLSDPGLRRRLGESAREYARREFSMERMAERAEEEYARVMSE